MKHETIRSIATPNWMGCWFIDELPQQYVAVTYLYTWMKRENVEHCLRKQHSNEKTIDHFNHRPSFPSENPTRKHYTIVPPRA